MYDSIIQPKKAKQFCKRLRCGILHSTALIEQHKQNPFTHKATLTFNVEMDVKRWRKRVSKLAQGRWDIVWNFEVSKNGTNHYHLIIRTACSKSEFESYICETLSKRKGNDSSTERSKFTLHWDEIDTEQVQALFLYTAKATPATLNKNKLQAIGTRETWITGKPFSKTKRQLIYTDERRFNRVIEIVENDADLLTAIINGKFKLEQLWDKRFQWHYKEQHFAWMHPVPCFNPDNRI